MRRNAVISAALALSAGISLVGCAGIPTGALTGLIANLNPQQQAAVQSMVNDYLVASQMNQDMSDGDALAGDSVTTQALGAEASAGIGYQVSASTRLKERMDRFKQKSKARLDKKKGALSMAIERTWDEASLTLTASMEFQHKKGSKKQVITKTYAEASRENLVKATFHLEQQHEKGMSLVIDRKREQAADGVWTLSYEATFTRKDGKVKTVVWTRTEAADGTQSGHGTLTRFDGSVVNLTFTKTADGETVTRTVDASAQLEAVVTQDEASAEAQVQVKNQASGQVTGTATLSVEDAEPSEQ